MKDYLPAVIALVGVLIGLSVNHARNARIERRDAYVKLIDAYDAWWNFAILNPADRVAPAALSEALGPLNRAALTVRIIAPKYVADVAARLADIDGDDDDLMRRNSRLFLTVARVDLALGFKDGLPSLREYMKVRSTDWFKNEVFIRPSNWWEDAPTRPVVEG